jgi:hypothetical protein
LEKITKNNIISRSIYLVLFFTFSVNARSQVLDWIEPDNFNKLYLEHLIKIKIDDLRKSNGCSELINDSILYLASDYHSTYMKGKGKISHYQDENKITRDPQDRAVYFGAKNYSVGENVLMISYNSSYNGKKGLKLRTDKYTSLADAIVDGWRNSPGHFKNIITPEFQITGVAIDVDLKLKTVYACQTFAKVAYKYSFNESKTLFPYSSYQVPLSITDFSGIEDRLIPYKYKFGLKHDNQTMCDKCKEIVLDQPYLSLKIENEYFILKVEDSEYIKKLLNNKYDGFAVEIIKYDDYVCDNPDYYQKPSRRNGQLLLDGETIEPIYYEDLLKGFKKRKKRDEVNFVSYIFKADSISFFKRFRHYKLDKYSHEYFEIKLGKVPKDISGLWMYDLVYLQDKQICHIDYFAQYCGELFQDYENTEFIPATSEGYYDFIPDPKELNFTIPFDRGKFEYSRKDILPFIQALDSISYNIDSVSITAFSSIEGDSLLNKKLQEKRAESVAKALKLGHNEAFPVQFKTETDRKGFYDEVKKHSSWSYLAKIDHEKSLEEMNRLGFDKFEEILSKQRRAQVKLYYSIPFNEQTRLYYIDKEVKQLDSLINAKRRRNQDTKVELEKFNKLYGYVHSLAVSNEISAKSLAKISLPSKFILSSSLSQKFILYGYEFMDEFNESQQWIRNQKDVEGFLVDSLYNTLDDIFLYNFYRKQVEKFIKTGIVDLEEIQYVFKGITSLNELYYKDEKAKENIEIINYNLNILLLNKVYQSDPIKYSNDALYSIIQLVEYFSRRNELSKERAIELAKCSVFFRNELSSIELLEKYANEDSIIAYQMSLKYHHYMRKTSDQFYDELIKLSNEMRPEIWCNMFINECAIPFQAFDNDSLRHVFCEKCLQENEVMKRIYK